MDITNDPRFFTENVLTARLTAFASLGVVAGLMVQNSLDHLFAMQKRMNPFKGDVVDGSCQLCGFLLLGIVQYLNVIATYVGVAQPYHTIRLMTAGPAGFEASACYYLNPNISTWRHFAVSMALISLPIFLASSGLRMIVKFDRENYDFPDPTRNSSSTFDKALGWGMCVYFLVMAATVLYVHRLHFKVFDEKYERVKPSLFQHREVLDVMSSRIFGSGRIRKTG
ncbi:unnamed protein product [Symbiodinium natans]|uniref:Uncharacterized protein n=1 Tax=Symbiodinium natans TaxID=878477 RepID=A0A812QP45_9DINO|nr:unnamed protein product [Symbiodinium natans]